MYSLTIYLLRIYNINMTGKGTVESLTPAVFYILLALSIKERHGYNIMKQVSYDSGGKVSMGPGTLYGSIKRMIEDGLVKETDERPDPELDDERRRYYKLTEKGEKYLSSELERYAQAVEIAKKRNLLKLQPTFELAY